MTTLEVTPEVARADGKGRVVNTTAQTSAGAALVIVGEWIARELGWDGELPTAVASAIVVLLGTIAAGWSNRHKLRGEV